jgi:hypothetical protein
MLWVFPLKKCGCKSADSIFIIGLLSSVVINYLWQREKVIVVKTSPGVWGAEICDTTIWTGNTWCTPDHAHAYTLLGYTPIETFTTGTDDPDLEIGDPMDTVRGIQNLTNYELDLETVVLASEWTQSQTKKFRSEIPADILRNTLTTPGEQQHKELKGVFNLPFCDLEVLIPKNQEFMKSIDCELGKNTDSGKQASCWKQAVICLCGNLQDTDGQWLSDYEDWMKPDNMCTDVIPTNLAGKDPLEGVIDLLCPIAIGGTLCTA